MPLEPRMDSALVLDSDGKLWVKEGRRVARGAMVAVGSKEDGSEGIYVDSDLTADEEVDEFKFMTSEVSREKPLVYSMLALILIR
jgi:hypothetical protein